MMAHILTLPKYGTLLVDVDAIENDHFDADRNKCLDISEAETFLTTYWPFYTALDPFIQYRVLQDVLDTYAAYGMVPLWGELGQSRWIPETCEGCLPSPMSLEVYTSASVATPNTLVVKSRRVQYLPKPHYKGLDVFQYTISLNSQESSERGMARIQVMDCRDQSCRDDLYLASSMRQRRQQ